MFQCPAREREITIMCPLRVDTYKTVEDMGDPGTIIFIQDVMRMGKTHLMTLLAEEYVKTYRYAVLHNIPSMEMLSHEDAVEAKLKLPNGKWRTKLWAEFPGTTRAETVLDWIYEASVAMTEDIDRPNISLLDEIAAAFSHVDTEVNTRQAWTKLLPLIRKLKIALFAASPIWTHTGKVLRDYCEGFLEKDYEGVTYLNQKYNIGLSLKQVVRLQSNPKFHGGDKRKHRWPIPIYLTVLISDWAKPYFMYKPKDLGFMTGLPSFFDLGEYVPGVPFNDVYLLPKALRGKTDEEVGWVVKKYIDDKREYWAEMINVDKVLQTRRSAADVAIDVIERAEDAGVIEEGILIDQKYIEDAVGRMVKIHPTKRFICDLIKASINTVNVKSRKGAGA